MHIMKKQVLLIILLALPLWLKAADVSVTGLRTEQMVDPMGLDTAVPRMSWRLESSQRNVMQTAYRILVASSPELLAQDKGDLWDSGKVESDASVWILYQGKRLKSNQRVYWKVRSYTNRGETEWSEPARWGMGPLGEIHWGGRWIGWDAAFAWDREDSHSRLSSRYLRTEFKTQAKEIKYATLHLCGLGMYELFINGQRIGDQVLAPAPSDYRRTVLYNSFDVTKQVAGGNADNAIGVTLGNGRFYTMRQNYKPYKIPTFGYPKLRLNLIIEYTDGSIQRINSDEKWRLTAQGPIRSNNEYDGEIYDARMELGNWTQPGYDDSKWLKAQRVSLPYGTLRGNTAPNMKVMKTLKPAVFKQYGNRYMIDFGQNMAGWVRINIAKAAAGDTICIRYAERVKNDGTELDVENLRHSQSTDYYICNGKENNTSWSSRFSYHGFQYVEVTGYKNLKAEDLVAEVVYDDLEDNGTFECSNDIMNRVYRNAWWGISSNYKGVPLDCPQRDERQPWLGDHAMGTWGESFMFNNGNTYAKWADDIREAQREDGCIPDICPAYYNYYTSEMTWSSTFPVICDMVYEQFGNIEPIRKNYAAIKKWMHHIRSEFTTEDGVINADKYGDWCMPPESPELIHSQDPARKTDGALIATAYYYKVSQMLAKFARLQGLEDEAKEFEKDAAKIKDCFNARFLTVKKGTSPVQMPHVLYPDSIFYGNNTVTANILPLAFDMVPEAYREEVEKNVITGIITRNKGHISSGVIGMNWMMRELTRMGRGDVAFLLASNKTYPSYGYMIEKGATAIWELWNGDTANRWMNSCNHVMILGDLLTWYFRDLAGFNPAQPAYKQIIFKPDFSIQELSYVKASHNTFYYADCRGEDVQARINKGAGRRVSPYYFFDVTADDNFNITLVWNQPYKVIHQANSLIEKLDAGNAGNAKPEEVARIKSEALAMRGLALFDLTRLFGMPYTLDNGASLGVPIEIQTTLEDHAPERNTVAQCYEQVLKDLNDALGGLTKEKHDAYMNYWSVKALLSRVYLYMNDNENALKCAEEVINDNGGIYRLFTHDEYPSVWGKDFNSESLFEFYFTMSEPSGGSGGEGAPMVYADNVKDWNNLILTKAYLDLLNEDPEDVRHVFPHLPENAVADTLPVAAKGQPKYLIKYPGKSGSVTDAVSTVNPQDNDLCILRLSEVYLNAAEAAFKIGNTEKALTYLNAIVTRANPAKSVTSADLSLERILKERRKELVGEGHAFFDYMRNGKSVDRSGGWHLTMPEDARVITPSDPRVALPIPQTEIDANPNIVQNPR